MASPYLILLFLLTLCFSLATQISIERQKSSRDDARSGSVLEILMGDSRRLFANHFFTKADVYLHRGVYPSIFDQAAREQHEEECHLADQAAASSKAASPGESDVHEHEAHSDQERSNDWIEAFGRNFYPTQHTHLDEAATEDEILPWLRLAADLNPNQPETYTVTAYWLSKRMGKVDEARKFLVEGWRANPDSFEILFELGRLYEENRQDDFRARNLYEAALRKWQQAEAAKADPDKLTYQEITGHLARLEERAGHVNRAIAYLEMLEKFSPHPEKIRQQIAALRSTANEHAKEGNRE